MSIRDTGIGDFRVAPAVLALISVAVLGFLPRATLMTSGVASLDDRRAL